MAAEESQIPRAAGGSPDAEAPEATLRADARENRHKILDAARHLFAAKGIDVPMAAIAREAGVGMATLYRRFPTRQELLTEVFAEQFAQCAAIVEAALADPDAWRGLRTAVEGLTAMQAEDHGFSAAFVEQLPQGAMIEEKLRQGVAGFQQLIHRAQKSGQLRRDFAFDDLALVLMANSGVVHHAPNSAAATSRRLVGYLLDAFRTDGTARQPLPPPVPTDLNQVAFPPGPR
ncbi:TetR/AcrR family transcriptional regulator [Streptosporangium sp. V21-05]|uniref:TetR/AcrR family transcriptional regulator n=1 Tax=Streptosporangium sp. V21-05 TaxID=3446115 RepID=UPI003F53A28B